MTCCAQKEKPPVEEKTNRFRIGPALLSGCNPGGKTR